MWAWRVIIAPVPDFVPFPAIRYATDGHGSDLSAVCAPPYDVIQPDERAALLAADPHNAVRLILPDSYAQAAAFLAAWRAEGTLRTDHDPTFSVYRMHFADEHGGTRTTTGVIGALGLDREGVQLHERTLPRAKGDRLELLRATRANLDPIWGLSLAPGLSAMLPADGAPLATALDGHGVRHELWAVRDPDRLDHIRATVSTAPLVLADGHHRFETACAYHDEQGAADDGAGSIMTLVVELAPEQLCVRAIHRLLAGVTGDAVRAAAAGLFDVRDVAPNTPGDVDRLEAAMHAEGAVGLATAEGLALLVPRPELDARLAAEPAALHGVDSARADAVLAGLPGATVAYRDDARTVAAAVTAGDASAALLLRPVDIDTIRAAADAGVRMPEKTTYFAPKPRTGMVFRSLDG
jgi:uncharacterized protein (DUF1015 family)